MGAAVKRAPPMNMPPQLAGNFAGVFALWGEEEAKFLGGMSNDAKRHLLIRYRAIELIESAEPNPQYMLTKEGRNLARDCHHWQIANQGVFASSNSLRYKRK